MPFSNPLAHHCFAKIASLAVLSMLLLSNIHRAQKLCASNGASLNLKARNENQDIHLYVPKIKPLWTCQANPLKQKLVFVHVFKTAGSTFRHFMEQYGQWCGKSVTVVIGCSGVKAESFDGTWTTTMSPEKKNECKVKSAWDESTNHTLVARNTNMTRERFQQSDIFIGHTALPPLLQGSNNNTQQYITFVRDPVHKFVSGRLFVNQNEHWTHDEAVKQIQEKVKIVYETTSYYDGYSRYLLTPLQQQETSTCSTARTTMMEDRVQLMKQNMMDFPMVVGVTERMTDSLDLLGFVMGAEGRVAQELRKLDPTQNASPPVIRNKSALSTSKIVADLLASSPDMAQKVRHILRYDQQVYDFALQIHERQLDWLRRHK